MTNAPDHAGNKLGTSLCSLLKVRGREYLCVGRKSRDRRSQHKLFVEWKTSLFKLEKGETGGVGQETRGRGVGGGNSRRVLECGRERGKGERKEGEIFWATVMPRCVLIFE